MHCKLINYRTTVVWEIRRKRIKIPEVKVKIFPFKGGTGRWLFSGQAPFNPLVSEVRTLPDIQ